MNYQVLDRPSLDAEALTRDPLDILRFAVFLRNRWHFIAIACSVAVTITVAVSLLLPKEYTATATLLIESPAGNDPRGATAISPVYLESLKTYERFALSDSLFARALDRLHLRQRYSRMPLESLKKKVLRVTKPRDTKILEISATLSAPRDSQALAQYMANETVQLNASLDRQSQRNLSEQVSEQLAAAATRLDKAEKAREGFLAENPIEPLESVIRNGTEQKLRLQNELVEARVDLVDYEARIASQSASNPGSHELSSMREQLAASKARTARIEQEDRALRVSLAADGAVLERRKHQREILDNERQAARTQYEAAATRRNDTVASAAFRSERLEIVDPGAIPERPSSPNIALNVIVAFFTALIGSMFFLAFRFSYSKLSC